MSIENTNVIDVSGIKNSSIVLTISDHFGWESYIKEHLEMLQAKINSYLAFIESGQVWEEYPTYKAYSGSIVILVIGKYKLCNEAKEFYSTVSSIVAEAGFQLEFELLED
jgi:hypothetical protein